MDLGGNGNRLGAASVTRVAGGRAIPNVCDGGRMGRREVCSRGSTVSKSGAGLYRGEVETETTVVGEVGVNNAL